MGFCRWIRSRSRSGVCAAFSLRSLACLVKTPLARAIRRYHSVRDSFRVLSKVLALTHPASVLASSGRRSIESYLVDPASSHMLVSKIKPCMSKFTLFHGETANGSLNQSRFLR